jgi:benzil reductase ((S)-benzoin forming)
MNASISPTPVTILTGASRGLGLAIAQALLARGHRLLTLQRQPNAALAASGAEQPVEQWALDLAEPAAAAARLHDWIANLPRAQIASITLINNAAALTALAPLGDIDAAELAMAMRVGLEAPLLLTAAFLRASADIEAPRKVLNISSGLGRFAMAGSAPYCAAKAGMDHFSRAVALEEAARPNGTKIVSLAPGVIDTDMQRQLRSADAAAFPDRARFVSLHAQGQLDSPAAAAAKIVAYLDRRDFGINAIGEVRDPA